MSAQSPGMASIINRKYASLSDDQKKKLKDGPDLGDFISGDVLSSESYTGNLKSKAGER